MKHTTFLSIFLFVVLTLSAQQTSYRVLPWNQSTAYNSYLTRMLHQQYRERDANFAKATQSKVSMEQYINDARKRYQSIAGNFSAKSNLNAQIVGTQETENLRIENVVFESVPGRFVTCNLYLPKKINGKIPAAIELCGHGINGKIPSRVAPLLALNGIAVLVVDPIGQGERLQLIDNENNALTRGATTEHTLLNTSLNLLGTSLAAQEFFDNSRAIDYLLTRAEIDADNLAVYGSSGGGTQTTYYLGLDPRVKVATICSFFSQRERTFELQGASDGCQHIPYEGREGLELADFALMHAPKPLLVMAGKYDFVDFWGAQQGFADLKKAYTALGAPEKVDLVAVETGHGMGREKQERMIRWFRHWMLGKTDNPTMELNEKIDVPKLYCTQTHQVNTSIKNAVSLMDENIRQYSDLQQDRDKFMKSSKSVIDKKIRELLGIGNATKMTVQLLSQIDERDYKLIKYQLLRDSEMAVPVVVLIPDKATAKSPIRFILTEKGKSDFFSEVSNITSAITDGTILVGTDLRGLGETADPASYNDAKYWNFEYRNAMLSMHCGKPVVGQRVQDILSIVEFISNEKELKSRAINLKADGIYGVPALHAAVLEKNIASCEVSHCIKTYKSHLENPLQYDMYSNVIYGVLSFYDLPDLIKLSDRRARFAD